MRSGVRPALAAALIASLCGCAGHGRAAPARSGRAVFAAACAGCHSLSGHDTPVRGGDLAIAPLSARDVASFVRVMPVQLSTREVEEVAAYVHAAARARARRRTPQGVSVH